MNRISEHQNDESWMHRCLDLAARGAGTVSPNPLVGAVVIHESGELLGEGYHQKFGAAHAEVEAIRAAEAKYGSEALKVSTLYVNLEPCCHHGKTPPCTNLILQKGIPRVVTGMTDPFPGVAGNGIRKLVSGGVTVRDHVLEGECRRLNEAFSHHLETGRPLVVLKIAQTLDGNVATSLGESRWISGKESRTLVHKWRAEFDAVLVGSGTALRDNPTLTVRHTGGRQPVRVVLDREGKLPVDINLFSDDYAASTVAVVGDDVTAAYEATLARKGGRIVRAATQNGRLNLQEVLLRLGKDGGADGAPLQSVLVEAGRRLTTALFLEDLVDRLYLFVAPKIIGGGLPSLGELGTRKLADAHMFPDFEWVRSGDDMLFKGYRRTFRESAD